jgi:hypothetical protein
MRFAFSVASLLAALSVTACSGAGDEPIQSTTQAATGNSNAWLGGTWISQWKWGGTIQLSPVSNTEIVVLTDTEESWFVAGAKVCPGIGIFTEYSTISMRGQRGTTVMMRATQNPPELWINWADDCAIASEPFTR